MDCQEDAAPMEEETIVEEQTINSHALDEDKENDSNMQNSLEKKASLVVQPKTDDDQKAISATPMQTEDENSQQVGIGAENSTENEANASTTHVHSDKIMDADAQQKRNVTAPHPKKPSTAYFLFLRENREKVKEQHPGLGIGAVGKILGQMWGSLDADAKQEFNNLAEKDKARYEKEVNDQKAAGTFDYSVEKSARTGNTDPHPKETTNIIFPIAKVKRTCKLDPDVKNLSKEAVHMIAKATELFTAWLAEHTLMPGSKSVKVSQIAAIVKAKDELCFLTDEFQSVQAPKQRVSLGTANKKSSGKRKHSAAPDANAPSISSFFSKQTTSSTPPPPPVPS